MPAHAWVQQPALGQVCAQTWVLAHGCDDLAPELAWQVKAWGVLAHALSPLHQPQLMLSLALVLHPLQVRSHEIKSHTPVQVRLGQSCVMRLSTADAHDGRLQIPIEHHFQAHLPDWLCRLERGTAT